MDWEGKLSPPLFHCLIVQQPTSLEPVGSLYSHWNLLVVAVHSAVAVQIFVSGVLPHSCLVRYHAVAVTLLVAWVDDSLVAAGKIEM